MKMKWFKNAFFVLSVFFIFSPTTSMAQPAPPVAQDGALWGISLNGFSNGDSGPSSLYVINRVTGAGTLIGSDLGYAVNAIAIDPTTGVMYASTTTWSGAFNGLLVVDTSTGTATEVGEFGDGFAAILGLTFDSTGQLWGWHDPSADDPVRIDKATGVATTVGDAEEGTSGQVLAFDASDTLFLMDKYEVFIINQTTGLAVFDSALSFDPGSGGGAFDMVTGLLWASATTGKVQDSLIRVTDIAGDSFTDIDTDVEYLNALTIGGHYAPANVPAMGVWSVVLLVMLVTGFAAGVLRKRYS